MNKAIEQLMNFDDLHCGTALPFSSREAGESAPVGDRGGLRVKSAGQEAL